MRLSESGEIDPLLLGRPIFQTHLEQFLCLTLVEGDQIFSLDSTKIFRRSGTDLPKPLFKSREIGIRSNIQISGNKNCIPTHVRFLGTLSSLFHQQYIGVQTTNIRIVAISKWGC